MEVMAQCTVEAVLTCLNSLSDNEEELSETFKLQGTELLNDRIYTRTLRLETTKHTTTHVVIQIQKDSW